MIYQSLKLHISNDYFIVNPLDNTQNQNNLIIERSSGDIHLGQIPNDIKTSKIVKICGIFGMMRINSGEILIVISDKEKVGDLNGNEIFRVKKVEIFPFSRGNLHLTPTQKKDDEVYLSMVTTVFKQCNFYFSYKQDITNSAQKKVDHSKPSWSVADERFYWNSYMQTRLTDLSMNNPKCGYDEFILPVICGYCAIRPTAINNNPFVFALISRRSRYRAGTRYNTRGVDDRGNVANYVETEQYIYIESNKQIYSYIQTRGSIPLYWKQITNVKYTPRLSLEPNINTSKSFKKHFKDQLERYGSQIVINLINKKGYELKIGNEFAKQIEDMHNNHITYVHFDFHHECRKMQWNRISILIDQIEDNLVKQGYCHINENGEIIQKQNSICRTNCMDCLDRTNVVQSVLAKRALNYQLREVGVLGPQQSVENAADFIYMFNNVWADNANAMSVQYSGTNALKTDFTRTGKRTKVGAFNDFSNSVVRYVKNNFLDGARQDSYDLFLGNYIVNSNNPSPFISNKNPKLKLLPYALIGSAFMLFISLFGRKEISGAIIMETIFWLLLLVGVVQQIFSNGEDIVSRPMLIKPMFYKAPSSHKVGGGAPIQLNDIKIRKDKEK